MFPSKKLLIGITGSIAAFKVATVISSFRKKGWEVKVIATPSALEFIGQATLEGLSENEVLTSDFSPGKMMSHITLARWADIFLIAPATAKTLNALAAGTGDGILHTTYLAYESHKPLLVAPAMNTQMLNHPTTQNALSVLATRGVQLLSPDSGALACGEFGDGRMMEPADIEASIERALAPKNKATKILLTMGGTRVPIDGVRSITNTSSGATGAQLADDLYLKGYDVTVLAAKSAVQPKLVTSIKLFDTYDDLENQLETTLKTHRFNHVIHMAAVSDFKVEHSSHKIPSGEEVTLKLTPTKKLIAQIKALAPQAFLTGFKLTVNASPQDVDNAVKSVIRNGANAVIHNDTNHISKSAHTFTLYSYQGPIATVGQKADLVSLFTNTLFAADFPFGTNTQRSSEVSYDSLS